jgi:uncharacterized membrane protein YfcA
LIALAAAAALAGATVQSATGFGFALIASPALFAVLSPYEAVSALLLMGLLLNVLVLMDRSGVARWRTIAPMLAFGVPGLAAGAALLSAVSKPVLQVAVGASVVVAAALQSRAEGRQPEPHEPSLGSAAAVGFTSGAMTTATSVSGPPIVLWLRAQGLPPAEVRASLAASFLALNLAGGVAVLVAGGADSLAEPDVLLPLLALVAIGHVVGARLFRRIDQDRFRSLVLALVVAAGVASAVAGLASL